MKISLTLMILIVSQLAFSGLKTNLKLTQYKVSNYDSSKVILTESKNKKKWEIRSEELTKEQIKIGNTIQLSDSLKKKLKQIK